MARKVLDLSGQFEHRCGNRDVGVGRMFPDASPMVELFGEPVPATRPIAQRPGRITNRRARAVADDVGHLGAVVAPVTLVDVLDDLFAAVALDVDVNVGRPIALGGEKPFEEQAQRDGVHIGDAEGVTHRRVGRRAPALAEDPGPAAELDNVPHHQEVAGEPENPDDLEFPVELRPGALHPLGEAGSVAAGATLGDQTAQVGHLVETVGAGIGRQVGGDELQIEGALTPQFSGHLDGSRPAGETCRLLTTRAQMTTGRGEPAVDLVEAAAGPNRGQSGGKPLPVHRVVVHVSGGDKREVGAGGQIGQSPVAHRILGQTVIPQLDDHVVRTEVCGEPIQ